MVGSYIFEKGARAWGPLYIQELSHAPASRYHDRTNNQLIAHFPDPVFPSTFIQISFPRRTQDRGSSMPDPATREPASSWPYRQSANTVLQMLRARRHSTINPAPRSERIKRPGTVVQANAWKELTVTNDRRAIVRNQHETDITHQ